MTNDEVIQAWNLKYHYDSSSTDYPYFVVYKLAQDSNFLSDDCSIMQNDNIGTVETNERSNDFDQTIWTYCEACDIQNASELPMGTQNLINKLNQQARKQQQLKKKGRPIII